MVLLRSRETMLLFQQAIPRLAPKQPHGHGLLCALLTNTQARQHTRPAACISSIRRGFTSTATCSKIQYPPRPKPPPDEEITEVYLKGSGPGGQKIVHLSLFLPAYSPSTPQLLCSPTPEQNQLRRPTQAHSDRHRHQMSGNALTLSKPQAGQGASGREDRRLAQWRK